MWGHERRCIVKAADHTLASVDADCYEVMSGVVACPCVLPFSLVSVLVAELYLAIYRQTYIYIYIVLQVL